MTLSMRWHPDAQADLRDLARRDPQLARRIQQRLTAYASTSQGDVRKLHGSGSGLLSSAPSVCMDGLPFYRSLFPKLS